MRARTVDCPALRAAAASPSVRAKAASNEACSTGFEVSGIIISASGCPLASGIKEPPWEGGSPFRASTRENSGEKGRTWPR